MNFDMSYYMAVFRRRFPYFALVTILLTTAGIVFAMIIPSEYKATATLLVESPQIPEKLAPSTVKTVVNEQLQIIERLLLTRANLLDTANRLDVFADEPNLPAGEVVRRMREQTTFSAETGRNRATFFRVSFRAEDPNLVARVTNEFVTLILEENVRIRTDLAGGTLEFFEEEVDRLGIELDNQSAEILKFKRENINSLPEDRDFLTSRLADLKYGRQEAQKQISLLESQKQNAVALFEITGSTIERNQISPERQALLSAQQELDQALVIYAPSHPRVRLLKARIAQAEARLSHQEAEDEEASDDGDDAALEEAPTTGPRARLNLQLADWDRKIDGYKDSIARIEDEIAETESWLVEIPANSVVLGSLQRDYENTQNEYRVAAGRLATAATGERIEDLSKGQRIIVLEQAITPQRPIKPNRPIIAMGGLGAGVSLGLGLILLLELLNQSIRRPVEITDKLGIAPFAVLPYIRTEAEVRWRRTSLVGVVVAIVIGLPLMVWAIHSFVTPLDFYAERLLNKVGWSLTF